MSVPIGITVPKLLPITGTFVPAFALYHSILAIRVSLARDASKQWIGDKSSSTSSSEPDSVEIANRCYSNFTENVPLALFLGAVVEMNGGNRRLLTAGLAGLLVFRLLHVELGLRKKNKDGVAAMGLGRPIGYFGTLAFTLGSAGYAVWLVKGYWGL